MTNSNCYNICNWKKSDIDNWVKGLDSSLSCHFPIENTNYDGKWLLNLNIQDLKSIGMTKIGNCMLFLETINVLVEELHSSANETFQTVIFRVNCDAVLLINMVDKLLRLKEVLKKFQENHVSNFYKSDEIEDKKELYPGQLDEIQSTKTMIVSTVLKLMNSVKMAVSWMNKPSFSNIIELSEMKKGMIEELKRINFFSQMLIGDKSEQKVADIKGMANFLQYRTEQFLNHFKDSIYLTPCLLENVLIHKTDNTAFGLNVKTIGNNLHIIESIDSNSPAYNVGKLEEGDEILEINEQVIVGWEHHKVVDELRSHQKKLCLRLKKRPLHVSDSAMSGAGRRKIHGNRRLHGAMQGNIAGEAYSGHGSNPTVRSGVLSRPSKRIPHSSTGVVLAGLSSGTNLSSTNLEQTMSKPLASFLGQSASTPATPVLASKSSHQRKITDSSSTNLSNPNDEDDDDDENNNKNNLDTNPLSDNVLRSLSLSPPSDFQQAISSVQSPPPIFNNISDLPKIDDPGSEGEYSAGDNSPYISRHRVARRYKSPSPNPQNSTPCGTPCHSGAQYSNSPTSSPFVNRNSNINSRPRIHYDSDFVSPPAVKRSDNKRVLINKGQSEDEEELNNDICHATENDSPSQSRRRFIPENHNPDDIRKYVLRKLDPSFYNDTKR